MEDQKKGFSPWIITVLLGVIAILFSVFGFQQQGELQEAQQMIVQLREEVMLARMEAENMRGLSEKSAAEARAAARESQASLEKVLKDCGKKTKVK